jgi:hypothetical protein
MGASTDEGDHTPHRLLGRASSREESKGCPFACMVNAGGQPRRPQRAGSRCPLGSAARVGCSGLLDSVRVQCMRALDHSNKRTKPQRFVEPCRLRTVRAQPQFIECSSRHQDQLLNQLSPDSVTTALLGCSSCRLLLRRTRASAPSLEPAARRCAPDTCRTSDRRSLPAARGVRAPVVQLGGRCVSLRDPATLL